MRAGAAMTRRRRKAENVMTYLVLRQAPRHGRVALSQADQCAGVVSSTRRGTGIEAASNRAAYEDWTD